MKKIYRILIADDDPDMIKLLLSILTEEGFQVFTCQNGEQVLSIVNEKLPDLILLDWMMPKKTGIEVISELKKDSNCYEIPIVMLTGQTDPKDLEYALEIGADDFVKKPFSKLELISRIKRQLKQQKMTEEIQNLKISQMYFMNQTISIELAQTTEQLQNEKSRGVSLHSVLDQVLKKVSELDRIHQSYFTLSENLKEMILTITDESNGEENSTTLGNPLFKNYLADKYSDLTESELRLCTIIILNLKNSAIAEHLFVSVRTVENHRYHISKKMFVPKGVNLNEFLKKIEKEFLFSM